MKSGGYQDQERRLDGCPYSRRHYTRAVIFPLPECRRLSRGPAAVQVDRDPRRRLAIRGDGIEDCFRPIVLCRLPTLCGGNDALGLDPYQAPAEHRLPVRRASFVMVALA